jgi:hypothetical protein
MWKRPEHRRTMQAPFVEKFAPELKCWEKEEKKEKMLDYSRFPDENRRMWANDSPPLHE